jgi:hypothetical protein
MMTCSEAQVNNPSVSFPPSPYTQLTHMIYTRLRVLDGFEHSLAGFIAWELNSQKMERLDITAMGLDRDLIVGKRLGGG